MTGGEISLSYELRQPINIEDTIKSRFFNNRVKYHDSNITAVLMVQIQSLILFLILGSMIFTRISTSIGMMFLKLLLEENVLSYTGSYLSSDS